VRRSADEKSFTLLKRITDNRKLALKRVLYIAAHGDFAGQAVPLGGGAAVCTRLLSEWTRTRPFAFDLISPSILGALAPSGRDIVGYGEREYAGFCRRFSAAATAEVLRHDPREAVVLANDISEGPDFARLAQAGFAIATIYHVDVVAYVAAMYARSVVHPETMVRWYDRIEASPVGGLIPSISKLVFEQQRATVRHSQAIVVPSQGMKDVLLRCYPWVPPERIRVLPWGAWTDDSPSDSDQEIDVPDDALVLMTLSRISPEKGQDLLLEALLEWESRADLPSRPLYLFLCGEAAYMQGRRFLAKLHAIASKLKRTKVVFPGYVTGARKAAILRRADLYVFPSRHESYGLTLAEALHAGVPAVCLDHSGAREIMRPEFGIVARPETLRVSIQKLLSDDALRARMSAAAAEYGKTLDFTHSAAELASILCTLKSSARGT
jgi:glycosyltransferase involved in cell wall biosynthesis